jgi:phosphopantothenoylcysteine decarboxylase/phosphopantothenate--cysteine ligase
VITGPHSAPLPHACHSIRVNTAGEMLTAVDATFDSCDVFVAAAAVADYRADMPLDQKRKREAGVYTLTLVPNPDIAALMGERKRPGQISIGFAAETHDIAKHGEKKLKDKRFDLLCANEVGGSDSGFGTDTHRAWLILPGQAPKEMGLVSKELLAEAIFDAIGPPST